MTYSPVRRMDSSIRLWISWSSSASELDPPSGRVTWTVNLVIGTMLNNSTLSTSTLSLLFSLSTHCQNFTLSRMVEHDNHATNRPQLTTKKTTVTFGRLWVMSSTVLPRRNRWVTGSGRMALSCASKLSHASLSACVSAIVASSCTSRYWNHWDGLEGSQEFLHRKTYHMAYLLGKFKNIW